MGSNPPSTCLCKPQAWGSSCVHCVSSWTSAHLGCPCAVLHPRAAAQVHVTPHLGCNETAPSPLSVPPSASQGNLSKVPMWSWHTLHTSLCFLSNSLWIKKKKKRKKEKGEQDPGYCLQDVHSTAWPYCFPGSWDPTGPCSWHPEPWAWLLVMPGWLPCVPTLKATSHPSRSSQSWPISAPVSPELPEGHHSQALALAGVLPATSAQDMWTSLSGSSLLSSQEQTIHWLRLCLQSCTGFE